MFRHCLSWRVCAQVLVFLAFFSFSPLYGQEEGRLITLSDGIGMVLKDSRLIKIAFADKEMSFEDSLMARSALLPHLSAFVSETWLKNQPASKFGAQTVNTADRQSLSYGFDVYQTIFDFGKSLSNFKASRALVDARQAALDAVRKLAVLEFITAYFDLLEAEKMIAVAEKEAETLAAYLKDVEHLYEAGSAVKNDLLPAKVKLADARQKLIAARNLRETAALRLKNMLAVSLREKIRVQDVDMENPALPPMDEAWKTAQAERPEIAIISSQIKASALSEKAKAVENYPVIFADGEYAYSQNRYMVHQDNASLNLGAKVNLFEGGAERADLLKERSRQKQLVEQKDKLIEDIRFEVDDSYLGLKDAGEKVAVAKDALEQAAENVRVNRVKYAEGSATSTDVLEAITLQTNAQTNHYRANYEVKRNYARLMYSMGIDLALVYDSMGKKKDGNEKQ